MKPGIGSIRLIASVPGAARIEPLISEFAKGGDGVVSSFSERLLRVASGLGDHPKLRFVSFGDLVGQSLVSTGEERRPLATGGLLREAIAASCLELPHDSVLSRSARFPGSHRAILATLQELHAAGVKEDDLAEASSEKFRSLAALDRGLLRRIQTVGRTTLSQLIDACLEGKPEGPPLRLLMIAGSGLTQRGLDWIQWTVSNGSKVTLVVESHASEKRLFAESAALCSSLNIPAELRHEPDGLLRSLFTEQVCSNAGPEIERIEAADMLSECEHAVRSCLAAIDGGTPPEQIGIFVRNIDDYAPLLEAAAVRLGLPIRASRRVALPSNRFAKLVLQTLECCSSQDVRGFTPILRSSYTGLALEQRNGAIEAMKAAYCKRESQWTELAKWASSADAFEWLSQLLSWRHDCLNSRAPIHEWILRLRRLVDILPFNPFGGGPTGERDSRAQSALQRSLYQTGSIDSERFDEMGLSQFVSLCKRIWENEDVSIPGREGGIQVVNEAESLGDLEVLHVLGMLEGVFPRRRAEEPVLSDAERSEVRALTGNEALRDSHFKASQERDEFYRVCASASRRLVFSYPQTNDNQDNVPAFYLSELERAAGGWTETLVLARAQLSPASEDCVTESDERLAEALSADKLPALENVLVTEAARAAFAWSDQQPISPKDLSEVTECPFRYFVRRRLHLRPNRSVARWARLKKLPQSSVLLQRATPSEAESALTEALDLQLDEMLSDAPAWEIASIRAQGKRLIREWVNREFVARKNWPKEGIRFEVPFSDPPFKANLPGITLAGRVPAASTTGPYKVTHLFETRTPRLGIDGAFEDPADEIYFGLHVFAQFEPGRGNALEIESVTGERKLLVLGRVPGSALASDKGAGLSVEYLTSSESPQQSMQDFFTQLRRKVKSASLLIRELNTQARPGTVCEHCDLDELCRKSFDQSEEDPFA